MPTTKPSEHTSLAAALAAFQAERPTVTKDATNPAFRSKYATLDAFEAVVLPRLAVQGLAWTCYPTSTDTGFMLVGRLLHVSGEHIEAHFPITGGTAQQQGSAMTYGRRYMLAAVTGVSADDDDDGNAASAAAAQPRQQRPAAPQQQPDRAGKITAAQRRALSDALAAYPPEDRPHIVSKHAGRGVASPGDLTEAQAATVLAALTTTTKES